jgi:ABC-type branched-subunit amino acid transport system permease subunit
MSLPVHWLKLLAVGVGAAVAALAGTINAALLQGAFPDDYNTQVLIIIYAMVILGGAGSLAGAVLGAFVVSVLMLEGLRPQTPIGDFTGNGRWVFYAVIIATLVAAIRPWRRLAASSPGRGVLGRRHVGRRQTTAERRAPDHPTRTRRWPAVFIRH